MCIFSLPISENKWNFAATPGNKPSHRCEKIAEMIWEKCLSRRRELIKFTKERDARTREFGETNLSCIWDRTSTIRLKVLICLENTGGLVLYPRCEQESQLQPFDWRGERFSSGYIRRNGGAMSSIFCFLVILGIDLTESRVMSSRQIGASKKSEPRRNRRA